VIAWPASFAPLTVMSDTDVSFSRLTAPGSKACGRIAGVREGRISAHDLRRAFAREFIRNGGDLESLRQLFGLTSYTMVRRYAELASDVVAETHEQASPGDRLRL